MASKFEVGMPREVTNFEQIVQHCIGFGSLYNPVNPLIAIPSLQTKLTGILAEEETNVLDKIHLDNGTNSREIFYDKIDNWSIRLMAHLKSLGLPKQTLDDAVAINRTLHGRRKASKKKNDPVGNANAEGGNQNAIETETGVKKISVSHLSYVSKADNVSKLVAFVANIPGYASNEEDLTVASMQAFAVELHTVNTEAATLLAKYKASLASRNQIMYHPETGMPAISRLIREYVKAVFGHKSPQYKSIAALVIPGRKI